MKLKNPLLQLN